MDSKPIYKSAEELGIEAWERDGLIALIGPMSQSQKEVNMHSSCGSICCIGGNLAKGNNVGIFEVNLYVKKESSAALGCLFYPGGVILSGSGLRYPAIDTHPGWGASASQAACAIVNFLTLGDPKWDSVMAVE